MTGGTGPAAGRGPVACLMGPTAVGKTALAIRLAERFRYQVVSVDSALVYRQMDIGTGKPSREERRRVPHRLVDIRDPGNPYSAADFVADAERAIVEIEEAGGRPLLVGGTGLYFRALIRGLDDLPAANPTVRERIRGRGLREGWPALHRELVRVDPAAAARIHAHDAQRIARALEVWETTGVAMSELHSAAPCRGTGDAGRYRRIVLAPRDRGWLHASIRRRFERMLGAGLVEEVRALMARGDLHPGLPAMRAVGYRQVWAYLTGQSGYTEMVEQSLAATRQLARRQLTWLRAEPDVLAWWFAPPDGAWSHADVGAIHDLVRGEWPAPGPLEV